MIGFRLLCAAMLAWALNWAIGRPEAAALVEEVPEMAYIAPTAGAIVGFIAIPRRGGWGIFISGFNGLWCGILSIALSGFLLLAYKTFDALAHNLLKDFEAFLRLIRQEAMPLIDIGVEVRLIGITVGAAAVVGFLSEFVHWCRARLRRYRGLPEPKKEVRAGVARAGGGLS